MPIAGTHSSSSIALYDSCPQAYHLAVENPDVVNHADYFERGRAFHTFAEAYLKGIYEHGNAEDASAAAFRAVDQGGYNSAAVEDARYFIEKFLDQELPGLQAEDEWLLEHQFRFGPDWHLATEGAHYTGRIDFGRIVKRGGLWLGFVRDYKSAWRVEPPSTILKKIQFLGYAYALYRIAENNGIQLDRVVLERHYVGQDLLQTVELTIEDLEKVPGLLDARVAGIESDSTFEPKPDDEKCALCPVRRLCPTYKAAGLAALEHDISKDRAEAAEQYATVQAFLDDLKTFLKVEIDAHGPITLKDGRKLSFVQVKKRMVRDDAISTLINKGGFDTLDILEKAKLGRREIDKLLKNHPKKEELDVAVTDEREESHLKFVKAEA